MRNTIYKQDGFTLIDMAVVMLIIGLVAGPFLQLLSTSATREKEFVTQGNFATVSDAIKAYYFENEYYPCPADPTLGPNDAGFGQENRLAPVAPATVGVCLTDASNPDLPNPGSNIMWGAVPHKALKLTKDQILDAWRNKLTYTVSTAQTHPTTYAPNGGVIRANRPFGVDIFGACGPTDDDLVTPPASPTNFRNLHLMLTSGGADGLGSYNINGTPMGACGAGATATADNENCDRDDTFIMPECIQNKNAGANYYDDLMFASVVGTWDNEPTKIWEDSEDPGNMGSVISHIGIGTSNPTFDIDQSGIEVVGNIRTSYDPHNPDKKGDVHASEYCNSTGERCFDPDSIANNDYRMNCKDNAGMTGIGSNRARCIDVVPSLKKNNRCNNDELAIGFTPEGDIICTPAI